MKTDTLHVFEIMLRNPEGITREGINAQLVSDGAAPVERKAFSKMLNTLRSGFHINIVAKRVEGVNFSYRVAEAGNSWKRVAAVLVSNLLENRFLEDFSSLETRVQPIAIMRGREYLRAIGSAMKNNTLLRCTYQKFTDTEPYECVLAPYVLKAFEGRWYIFALKWNDESELSSHPMGIRDIGLQAFALDRIVSLGGTGIGFTMYEGFDAQQYFEDYYGVFCDQTLRPSKIVIHAGGSDAHYIRTLPLHHSQKEPEPGTFTLTMCVTPDFVLDMHRFENTTWEVVTEH